MTPPLHPTSARTPQDGGDVRAGDRPEAIAIEASDHEPQAAELNDPQAADAQQYR